MKIVIVGAGRAGLEVATHLTRLGHAITIIDNDEMVTRRASEQHGLVALQRRRHHRRGARGSRRPPEPRSSWRCCGATPTTWPSRCWRAPPASQRVMVRMRDNAYRPVYAAAGIDRVLSETDLITGSVATAIEHDAIRHAMLLGNGSAIAFELTDSRGQRRGGEDHHGAGRAAGLPVLVRVRGALQGRTAASRRRAGRRSSHVGTTVLLVSRRDEVARAVDAMTAAG